MCVEAPISGMDFQHTSKSTKFHGYEATDAEMTKAVCKDEPGAAPKSEAELIKVRLFVDCTACVRSLEYVRTS